MSLTVGKYTFGAWMRKGIGRSVEEVDSLGAADGTVLERPNVEVDVKVNGHGVKKDFALIGPGDVIGVNPQTVVRTEPRDWITDYEPNYLPFVEFYEEDFAWRYTPAKAAGDRLRPWLALAVLEDPSGGKPGEYVFNERRLPLPTVQVQSTASLPPHTQIWAWGHVHVNDAFDNPTDFERFLESLESPDHPNADRIVCRLTSPRHLRPNTAYTAFVIPTFETGRLAGLGKDPAGVPAQKPSWNETAASVEFPVYYSWRFRSGENEDFESLVRKLEPNPVNPRVGIRDMDGEKPGWGLSEGTEIGTIEPAPTPPGGEPPPAPKQSVIGLEGALKAPQSESRPAMVDSSRPFFLELEDALNLPEKMRAEPGGADLPVVSPPIYGEHHALRHTVDTSRADWLDFLNRDPRQRVSAGFGTGVVQKEQEGYVARAWEQVQRILEANRQIRLIGWAMQASHSLYSNLAAGFSPAQKLIFFAPLLGKVRGSPTTLQQQLSESTLPPAAVSGAMRRMLRARGPLGRRSVRGDAGFSHAELVQGMAEGKLTAAPPKPVPADLATDTEVVSQLPDAGGGGWGAVLVSTAGRLLWLLLLIVLAILLVVALLSGAWLLCAVLAVLAVVLFFVLLTLARRRAEAESIVDPAAAAGAVAATPPQPGFGLIETDPVVLPSGGAGTQVTTSPGSTSAGAGAVHFVEVVSLTPGAGGGESAEGHDFRHAAVALGERLGIGVEERQPRPFDLGNAGVRISKAVDPFVCFPIKAVNQVYLPFDPDWLLEPEHLVPAMAYPDFDDPMYEKLRDLSSELLLPNIQLIPQNTITLLKTNPPFIESYLVGLNCEFGKELLWREYPTDRRGSYFRQFWDVRGIIATAPHESPAEVSERAKDIVPLDTWPSSSALGAHRNPKRGKGEQMVLTVRGELLKKYPNTLIYAQKAHLFHDAQGKPQPGHEPVVGEVASEADIAREIKFPVFHAAVEPDVRFFGFDISEDEARGDQDPQLENDNWGYYFLIQQLPGEPRFGMDVSYEHDDPATPISWDDLAWDRFPAGQEFIRTDVGPQPFVPAGPGESAAQWGLDSARMASILFQKPVMIAVHAKEMLDKKKLEPPA